MGVMWAEPANYNNKSAPRMIRLFRVFIPATTITLLISETILICLAYILSAYVVEVDATTYLLYDGGMVSIFFVLASVLMALYLQDLYSDIFVTSVIPLVQQLCLAAGAAITIQGVVSYLDVTLQMPLRMMLVGSVLMLVSDVLWRIFFGKFALSVVGRDRLLLLGSSALLADIARHVEKHPEKGIRITGHLDDSGDAASDPPGSKFLGRVEDLGEVVAAGKPTRIVVGMSERRNRVPVMTLLDLRFSGHIIEEAATCYERICGRVSVRELRPSQLIYSGELGPRRSIVFWQTTLNLITAAVGSVLALPVMLLTAIAVRLSSTGPVLYRQVRVGKNGVPFTLYKFRSMRVDAEAQTGAVWAVKDDPRVTPVGRIIRKTRLDELPQLFNVLKGEMSIVGPRPERPEFVQVLSEKIPYYRQRHCVRPGITGWAQINHKYGDTLEDTITKLEYDLYYIKNLSFSMDTYIIFHTVKAMLLSRGAQ